MRSTFHGLVAGGCLALTLTAQAAVVVVLPGDVSLAPVQNQWYRTNFRDVSTGFTSNTVAATTGAQPRSGNGSVEMSLTDGSGKVDYAYTWGYVAGNTLGNLTALSYDWYRSGASTNPAGQQPVLRLLFDADGDSSTVNDLGYLIWEQVYNGDPTAQGFANNGTVATDTWVTSNTIGGDFWQRRFTPGTTIEQYDVDLGEWMAGVVFAGSLGLSDDTAILGIEFGIGSGWNGQFTGYIDNVTYGFGTTPATTFNFELQQADGTVPVPGTLLLVGAALAGVGAVRRSRG